jgi:hypothetical protein
MSIQSEILPLRTLGKACHEGALERCCSVVCGLRPDIVEVAEQPPAISYIDDAGRHRRHIFNFRITTTKGERYLAAVKPSALVAISGIGRLIELVAEQMSPSFADYVALITEKELSRVDLFNAQAFNMATRDPRPEDDEVMAKVVLKMDGQASVGELV